MKYYLVSIEQDLTFTCEEGTWKEILQLAENNGWDPEGTILELNYEIEENWDPDMTYAETVFIVIQSHMKCLEWDGNYTDTENQVVKDSDAGQMLWALDGIDIDDGLEQLMEAGSFRICGY
ncbi:MAG: hypothetical protein ACOCX9_01650 [Spirochaetota bacterium]